MNMNRRSDIWLNLEGKREILTKNLAATEGI